MIVHSIVLIDTGFSIMPRTQAPSQGAGQTRPVNSGKLFVSRSLSNASFHLFWYTSSFHSGILFPRGQPVLSCKRQLGYCQSCSIQDILPLQHSCQIIESSHMITWLQKGVPQSIHRADCVFTRPSWLAEANTSPQSFTLSVGAR